jgi:hypothetical protein
MLLRPNPKGVSRPNEMNPSSSEPEEIANDIAALQAYRRGRLEFNMRIVEASDEKSEAVLAALRSDATYQLAEFYFLLSGFGIQSVPEFDELIERHNDYGASLLSDSKKMERMGLTKERLLSAIFDGETKPRVLKIWSDDPGALDQSSLARFLVAVMSDETARKTVVACGKAGFLERQNSVFRIMLVKSTGKLEQMYGQCLREIRLQIQGKE